MVKRKVIGGTKLNKTSKNKLHGYVIIILINS